MIGLNFVYERDELLYSLDLHIKLGNQFCLDYLDFDSQSLEDVIDYVEFLEFEQYIFVALEENVRLKRLVDYLKKKVTCPIYIFSVNDLGSLLSDEVILSVEDALEHHSSYQSLITLNTEQVYQNGYRAFMTAVYPNLTKGLLKHLRVDQLKKFFDENQSLLFHFAVNSAIYSDDSSDYPSSPIIIKSLANFKTKSFVKVTENELEGSLKEFRASGRLSLKSNVLDYGILSGISAFNSMVFENGKFYLDTATKVPIGYSGESYQKLFNKASMKLAKRTVTANSELRHLFPLLIAINSNSNYGDLEFITPYNAYHLLAIEEGNIPLIWIAFKSSSQNFALNIQSGRLFKVNQVVLEKFEYIIKNRVAESKDSVTQEVMEVLETYAK